MWGKIVDMVNVTNIKKNVENMTLTYGLAKWADRWGKIVVGKNKNDFCVSTFTNTH